MVYKKKSRRKQDAQNQPKVPAASSIDREGDSAPKRRERQNYPSKSESNINEGAIVNLTRKLVWWTAVLAVATFSLGVAAIFQWRELKSTDGHIAEQVKIANDQLNEMKGTGKQTEALISATKEAASAATKSANIADLSMKVTQRAQFTVAPSLSGFEKGGTPIASLSALNIGNTAAYSVSLKTYVGLTEYPLPFGTTFTEETPAPEKKSVVAKGEVVTGIVKMRRPIVDDAEFENLSSGINFRVVVYGVLDFKDVFNCSVTRKICFLYNSQAAAQGHPELCGDGYNEESHQENCSP